MIDCLVGGQILSAVSDGSVSVVVGIIINAVITVRAEQLRLQGLILISTVGCCFVWDVDLSSLRKVRICPVALTISI